MPVAREQSAPGQFEPVAIPRLFDFYAAVLIQSIRKRPRKYFGHMLHNHNRRTIGWQRRKKNTQRLGSTRRGAHRNYSIRRTCALGLAVTRRDRLSREAEAPPPGASADA